MSDLDGYGAEPQGPEAELRRRLGEHDFLVDLFQLSEQMRAFTETPAGAFLFAELKDDVNTGLRGLLEQPTLDSETARAYYARAKTAWAALCRIEEVMGMGPVADKMMTEMEMVTP